MDWPSMIRWVLPVICLVGCANRGMESPGQSSGGTIGAAGSAAGGATGGSAGEASHGTGGGGVIGSTGGVTGGGTGGVTGGGTGGVTGGGTGGATGGATGGTAGSGEQTGSGGAVGTGGGSGGATSGMGGGGAIGTGGAAGGMAGSQGTGGAAGGGGSGPAGQGGSAQTQVVVSIDFIGGMTSGTGGAFMADPVMAASEIAGVKRAANWNGAASNSGTLVNLLEAGGAATKASVMWNSPAAYSNPGAWSNGFPDAAGDVRMMNGYLDPSVSTSPATVVVSGLPASIAASGYDVYVYVSGNIPTVATRTYQYAIGTTSVTISETGPSSFSGFAQASPGVSGNYLVFRKVVGAGFTLTATPGMGTQTRAPVNGMQIVWPTGS